MSVQNFSIGGLSLKKLTQKTFKVSNLSEEQTRRCQDWKWRYMHEFHRTMLSIAGTCIEYNTFCPNLLAADASKEFSWIVTNKDGSSTLHIGSIRECPFSEGIKPESRMLVSSTWANQVSAYHILTGHSRFPAPAQVTRGLPSPTNSVTAPSTHEKPQRPRIPYLALPPRDDTQPRVSP